MIIIRLGRRRGAPSLHEFTYNDFVLGLTRLISARKAARPRCKVHPMHKAWLALWPIQGLSARINLSNNDSVTICGWRIEFDWDFPQNQARFG